MAAMMLSSPFGPRLKVLVLAGSNRGPGASDGPAGPEVPLADKAFRRLRGRLVVEYVLDVLHQCGLARIWLVAPEEQIAALPEAHRFVAVPQRADATFWANLMAGWSALELGPDEPVLVAFGDHPVTTPTALRHFLAGCAAQLGEADCFHAMALQASYREYAAWFRRTSFHTREMCGRATGLSLAVPSRLHRLPAIDRLYGVRKLERVRSLLSLMFHLGRWLGRDAPRGLLDTLLLYTATEMEKLARDFRVGARTGRSLETWLSARVPAARLGRYAKRVLAAERGVRLIPIAHGGLAIDVDFAEELTALEEHWDAIQAIAERQDRALAGGSIER
jgi:CTP:molybdopterin cytidylyltransferase MocA